MLTFKLESGLSQLICSTDFTFLFCIPKLLLPSLQKPLLEAQKTTLSWGNHEPPRPDSVHAILSARINWPLPCFSYTCNFMLSLQCPTLVPSLPRILSVHSEMTKHTLLCFNSGLFRPLLVFISLWNYRLGLGILSASCQIY